MICGKFNATIRDNIVSVRLNFAGKLRNRLMPVFEKKRNSRSRSPLR